MYFYNLSLRLVKSGKVLRRSDVFNLRSFYFLASVWKFVSDKTEEKEEGKTQKTEKATKTVYLTFNDRKKLQNF